MFLDLMKGTEQNRDRQAKGSRGSPQGTSEREARGIAEEESREEETDGGSGSKAERRSDQEEGG